MKIAWFVDIGSLLEPVLRCLLDWLEQKNNGQKNHQILIALASESLKKINVPDESRRFDKKDIWSACGGVNGEKDLGSWLKWPDIEKYCEARRDGFWTSLILGGWTITPSSSAKALLEKPKELSVLS